jgi:thiamine kinase-like enzyme
MYLDKQSFDHAVNIQRILYKLDPSMVVSLIDTWIPEESNRGPNEQFVVMKYGGRSIEDRYSDIFDILRDVAIEMTRLKHRLAELGYEHHDLHPANFVMDKNGNIRIIDYDDIDKLGPDDEASGDEIEDWEVDDEESSQEH